MSVPSTGDSSSSQNVNNSPSSQPSEIPLLAPAEEDVILFSGLLEGEGGQDEAEAEEEPSTSKDLASPFSTPTSATETPSTAGQASSGASSKTSSSNQGSSDNSGSSSSTSSSGSSSSSSQQTGGSSSNANASAAGLAWAGLGQSILGGLAGAGESFDQAGGGDLDAISELGNALVKRMLAAGPAEGDSGVLLSMKDDDILPQTDIRIYKQDGMLHVNFTTSSQDSANLLNQHQADLSEYLKNRLNLDQVNVHIEHTGAGGQQQPGGDSGSRQKRRVVDEYDPS